MNQKKEIDKQIAKFCKELGLVLIHLFDVNNITTYTNIDILCYNYTNRTLQASAIWQAQIGGSL